MSYSEMDTLKVLLIINILILTILYNIRAKEPFTYQSITSCLWSKTSATPYINNPKNNTTLNCSGFNDSVIYLLNAYYIRPAGTGDEDCFSEGNLNRCCEGDSVHFPYNNLRRRNRRCSVPIQEEVSRNITAQCNGETTCSPEVETVQLYNSCHGGCVFANQRSRDSVSDWCFARLVQIEYICFRKERDDVCTGTRQPTISVTVQETSTTTESTADSTVKSDDGTSQTTGSVTVQETSTTTKSTTTDSTEKSDDVTCGTSQTTDYGQESSSDNSGYIIGLAVSIPVSLIIGSLLTVLIIRVISKRRKAKEKIPHGLERHRPEGITSPGSNPSNEYFGVEEHYSNFDNDHQNVTRSHETSFDTNGKPRHVLTPDSNMLQPAEGAKRTGDNVYYGHMTSQTSNSDDASNRNANQLDARVGGGNKDEYVTFEEDAQGLVKNTYYAGGSTRGSGGENFEENPYYEGLDEKVEAKAVNGGIGNEGFEDNGKDPSGGKQKSKDGAAKPDNYVYTYGHFALEGRSREPANH